VQATFIKDGVKIKATEQPKANDKFSGNGAETLFDNEGGIADLNSKNFLSYMQDSIEIKMTLAKKEKIDSVLIDFLQDHGSWIFLPQKIKTYYFDEVSKSYELISQKEILSKAIINGSSTIFQILKSNKKVIADKLKIIIEPLQSMPEGHLGKGKQSWLFIDEIKIY
jgi:hexosaminidase